MKFTFLWPLPSSEQSGKYGSRLRGEDGASGVDAQCNEEDMTARIKENGGQQTAQGRHAAMEVFLFDADQLHDLPSI